jgi:hypothetical protein
LWVWAYPLQCSILIIAIVIIFRWDLNKPPLTATQKYLSIPFALYAGWLTGAKIPFTSDLLNKSVWNYKPFSQKGWALLHYVTACFIVWAAFRLLKQPFYLLPLAWALLGFAVRFDVSLQITSAVLSGLLVLYFFMQLHSFY